MVKNVMGVEHDVQVWIAMELLMQELQFSLTQNANQDEEQKRGCGHQHGGALAQHQHHAAMSKLVRAVSAMRWTERPTRDTH